jgi:hypothetical protein
VTRFYPKVGLILFFIFTITYSRLSAKDITGNTIIVSLLAFEAKAQQANVHLTWTSVIEINNEYYSIERSADGKNFESLSTIKGAGNSSAIIDYIFIDPSPLFGKSYYRLKQIDAYGNGSYSDIIGISISENPLFEILSAESTVHLTFTAAKSEKCNINIYGMDGSQVFNTALSVNRGKNVKDLECTYLEKGMYLLSISNDEEILSKEYFVLR